jgi:hypothetical protein
MGYREEKGAIPFLPVKQGHGQYPYNKKARLTREKHKNLFDHSFRQHGSFQNQDQ